MCSDSVVDLGGRSDRANEIVVDPFFGWSKTDERRATLLAETSDGREQRPTILAEVLVVNR